MTWPRLYVIWLIMAIVCLAYGVMIHSDVWIGTSVIISCIVSLSVVD